jgi:predicted nucleic acid-binding protein
VGKAYPEAELAMKAALLDTGPLVAYLDAADPAHTATAASLGRFAGTLFTTSAVITEAMYLLGDDSTGPRRLAEFVQAAGVHILESTQAPQLHRAVRLMEKYSDTPMDFADATLVLISEEVGTLDILTLDRRGFSTYRTEKGKALRIL